MLPSTVPSSSQEDSSLIRRKGFSLSCETVKCSKNVGIAAPNEGVSSSSNSKIVSIKSSLEFSPGLEPFSK